MNILQPAVAMVGVTSSVWTLLYVRRISFLQKNGINPQEISTPLKKQAVFKQHKAEYAQLPADNLANLFELPVLFYALCIMAYQLQITSQNLVLLAWLYVVLRAIHSIIHCSYNKVMHRFVAYFLSSIILWIMAVLIGMQVFGLS